MKDEVIQEGDLYGRAMPNLNEDDVAELMRSVQPLLDEDESTREWCSRAKYSISRFASPPVRKTRKEASTHTLLIESSYMNIPSCVPHHRVRVRVCVCLSSVYSSICY